MAVGRYQPVVKDNEIYVVDTTNGAMFRYKTNCIHPGVLEGWEYIDSTTPKIQSPD